MLTTLENRGMTTTAPDIATLQARVAQLRGDEIRHEQQLHAGQADLAAAEASINDVVYKASKGMESRADLTSWMFAQAAAQRKKLEAVEALVKTRAELGVAIDALLAGEAQRAASEAAAFEHEVIEELRDFAAEVLPYLARCQKLQILRERSRDFNPHLYTPGTLEALGASWGEIVNGDAVMSRLELIAKVAQLPAAPAEIVQTAARRRAIERKAELDRGDKLEAQRKMGAKIKIGYAFEMKYDEEAQRLVYREVFDY